MWAFGSFYRPSMVLYNQHRWALVTCSIPGEPQVHTALHNQKGTSRWYPWPTAPPYPIHWRFASTEATGTLDKRCY